MVPPSVPKFLITKLLTNRICIVFQRIWVQSLIFVTNEQMRNPLIRSSSSRVDFGLKSLDLHLKSSNTFLHFEREGLSLQGFSL